MQCNLHCDWNQIWFYLVPQYLRLLPVRLGFHTTAEQSSITGKPHLEWIMFKTVKLQSHSELPPLCSYSPATKGQQCSETDFLQMRAQVRGSRSILLTFQSSNWVYLSQVSYNIYKPDFFLTHYSLFNINSVQNPLLVLLYTFTYLEIYCYPVLTLLSDSQTQK